MSISLKLKSRGFRLILHLDLITTHYDISNGVNASGVFGGNALISLTQPDVFTIHGEWPFANEK